MDVVTSEANESVHNGGDSACASIDDSEGSGAIDEAGIILIMLLRVVVLQALLIMEDKDEHEFDGEILFRFLLFLLFLRELLVPCFEWWCFLAKHFLPRNAFGVPLVVVFLRR